MSSLRYFPSKPKRFFLFIVLCSIGVVSCSKESAEPSTRAQMTDENTLAANTAPAQSASAPVPVQTPYLTIINSEIAPVHTATLEAGFNPQTQVMLLSNFDSSFNNRFTPESRINVKNNLAFFDFDNGEITTASSADIYLDVSCGSDCFNIVIAINGARSAMWSVDTELDSADCQKALHKKTNVYGVDNVPGKYSCLLTNEGNVVEILAIDNEAHHTDSKFIFQYILWHPNQTP